MFSKIKIEPNQIGKIFIAFGILGILSELFARVFIISGCFGGSNSTKILHYCIYGLVILIGIKFKRKG